MKGNLILGNIQWDRFYSSLSQNWISPLRTIKRTDSTLLVLLQKPLVSNLLFRAFVEGVAHILLLGISVWWCWQRLLLQPILDIFLPLQTVLPFSTITSICRLSELAAFSCTTFSCTSQGQGCFVITKRLPAIFLVFHFSQDIVFPSCCPTWPQLHPYI